MIDVATTIDKVGGSVESKHAEILGKSTKTKPTDANVNDIYVECDTGDAYYFDGDTHTWQPFGD